MIDVIEGYCALRACSRYWVGVAEGNIYCKKIRIDYKQAIKDAKILFKNLRSFHETH